MNAAHLRQRVIQALMDHTAAQTRVYSPYDWPTETDDYPCILVQTPFDHKKSLGRHVPQFNTVTTVRISGRVQAFDGEEREGALEAEQQLETLREQIERAVINNDELTREIQQFVEIRSQIAVSAEGEGHLAQLLMDLDIEYYQGPEEFYPVTAASLDGIDVKFSMPAGTPLHQVNVDLETSQEE
ncbi:ATP-binding protein [Arsenophonus nasoniae]|uniref:ATP-binding protein n=1 Tax=Arsenophonus nasoniae TaxID=638 RepID=UPI00387935FF